MKNCAVVLILLACITSCSQSGKKNLQNKAGIIAELIEVDKAFSVMSEEKGMKKSFIYFIDSNGVLLRPNQLPIVGANAIDYLLQEKDSEYTITWEPQFAEAAISGELGYTFGIYQLHLKERDTSLYGSYVRIWKKQKDGKWKFVLHSRNEGIDDE